MPLFRGSQKKREKQGFFCLSCGRFFWWWCFSMWCPYARASLHAPSSLQMCDLSLMSYFFLLFSVLLFCWGGYSFLHSSLQWSCTNDQKHDQTTENPQYLKFLFLMFCFGACTLTLSPGPHNNRNPKPSTLENRICLLHNALNPVLKCLFLQRFSNINQICPKHRPLTKMITLHNAQNQAECFRNGLLWKLKTFMLTKTHNWKKNKQTKLREGIWKAKQKRKPPKNRNNWWKEAFEM